MSRKNIIIVLLLAFNFGCVQMRDYTSSRNGAFMVDTQTGFDSGVDSKDYYLIGDRTALIIGDSKKDVIFKMGLPNEIKTALSGDQIWLYESKKIDLFFRDNRLKNWSFSEDVEGDNK